MARINLKDRVLELRSQHPNWMPSDIARHIGCRRQAVSLVLRRAGLKSKSIKRLQEWEKQAIADAYADGEKLESVAAEFGCDQSAVSRIGKKFGHAKRQAGRRISIGF